MPQANKRQTKNTGKIGDVCLAYHAQYRRYPVGVGADLFALIVSQLDAVRINSHPQKASQFFNGLEFATSIVGMKCAVNPWWHDKRRRLNQVDGGRLSLCYRRAES